MHLSSGKIEKIGAQEIDRLNLPQWLSAQTLFPKVYWKQRDSSTERAALGSLLLLDHLPLFGPGFDEEVRFYGGMRFSARDINDIAWQSFAPCAFWLPAIEVVQTPQKTELHTYHSKDAKPSLHFNDTKKSLMSSPSLLQREEAVAFGMWNAQIAHVLDLIEKQQLQKVVLARKSTFLFSRALSLWDMLEELKESSIGSTLFAFQMIDKTAFFGASPEQLFYRKEEQLFIDALAATRRRGVSKKQDLHYEKELRTCSKEQREFKCVKDFIHQAMQPFTESFYWQAEENIKKTAQVQHLYNQASMTLKKGISDSALLAALHPTPAVGGLPRTAALDAIHALEPFDRGWFAAPVGWVSPQETSLIVAIRSALLQERTLHLFAGAGIVSQSNAQKEWKEIDNKMRVLLHGCGLIPKSLEESRM